MGEMLMTSVNDLALRGRAAVTPAHETQQWLSIYERRAHAHLVGPQRSGTLGCKQGAAKGRSRWRQGRRSSSSRSLTAAGQLRTLRSFKSRRAVRVAAKLALWEHAEDVLCRRERQCLSVAPLWARHTSSGQPLATLRLQCLRRMQRCAALYSLRLGTGQQTHACLAGFLGPYREAFM